MFSSLRAAGHATLPVIRKPIVAILSTGDELVEPGTPLQHGQIWASNSFGLAAMIEAAGGEARDLGIARNSFGSLATALEGAEGADVLVTIGGASVGDHDLVRPALEKSGARLDFYKIAMRPGKPLFFGSRDVAGTRQHCLGLPGNPVSALISARVFLVPLIGRMLGREAPLETTDAVLTTPIDANGPRQHYMRAELDLSHSPPRVTPFKSQDSGLITALQRADCLLVVAARCASPAGGHRSASFETGHLISARRASFAKSPMHQNFTMVQCELRMVTRALGCTCPGVLILERFRMDRLMPRARA